MDEKERIFRKVDSIIRQDDKSSYIGGDDYVILVKDGIRVGFHIKNPSLDIEGVFRTVRRAQKMVAERFGCALTGIEISLYDSKDEMRQEGRSRSRYASWIAGIFDGQIRIIAEKGDEEPGSLFIVLTHEIIHLAVFTLGQGNCPYWLDEGLAVYLSQELPDQYLNALQRAIKSEKTFPLDALQSPLPPDLDDDGIRQLAYSETSSVVEYLIETYGWEVVSLLVTRSGKGPFDAVLAELSLNHYLLEQGWKRWYRKRSA